ncbi:MAG: hypothetical protein OXT03_06575 [Alphaproteobacteria bacterium]|nr:hypothetical protein [Alphaproteobacteria bacterium]
MVSIYHIWLVCLLIFSAFVDYMAYVLAMFAGLGAAVGRSFIFTKSYI